MGQIVTSAVRHAADIVEGVARTVRREIPDEVGGIAAALSGSASGTAGGTLSQTWTTSYADWATSAEQHAQSMRDAANGWDTTDANVAASYGQSPSMTGPTGAMRYVNGGMEPV